MSRQTVPYLGPSNREVSCRKNSQCFVPPSYKLAILDDTPHLVADQIEVRAAR